VDPKTGRAVQLRGDPDHPITRGALCTKVNRYLERTYHPDRVLTPLRRAGPKGSGRFQPITWEQALDEIAGRLQEIGARWGSQAVLPYSYAGTMGVVQGEAMDRRFFGRLGASLLSRTICADAGLAGYTYTVGIPIGTPPEDFAYARLILIWGSNTLTSNMHLWPFIAQARKAGARLIVIDPVRTRTAQQADQWVPIRPGTDAALALSMMHVIVQNGLWHQEYVAKYTLGFDALRERVAEWPPERAAAITGLPVTTIEELARAYATIRPAAIRVNYGLQRNGGGGMTVRTIAILPALIGSWQERGGGILLSTSRAFPINRDAVRRPDLIPPGTRKLNMIRLGDALSLDPEVRAGALIHGDPEPPVMALVVYNSNPAAIAPDQNAVLAGLRREDLFTVVLEHFLTDTADHADIVLPATTQLEHWDLQPPYGHYYLTLNQPAIAPLGEAKPNSEIFRLLAARMGFDEPCFHDSDQDIIQQALDTDHPHLQGVTLERLLAEGSVRLNLPDPYLPFAEGGFSTPSGKCEFYSQRMAEDGYDPLPTFHPPYEVPIPENTSPESGPSAPLACVSASAHYFLNSTFVNVPRLRRQQGEPTVIVHPEDAAARDIVDGMWVRIRNRRGSFRARARVRADVRPGVVSVPSVWWRKLSPDGRSVNVTTSQAEADMGHGPTFYDNAVWIESGNQRIGESRSKELGMRNLEGAATSEKKRSEENTSNQQRVTSSEGDSNG